MARIAVIEPELLLASKVEATLLAAGHEVSVCGSLADLSGQAPDAIVADLEGLDVGELAALGIPTLGFYSHVDVETKRRADAAGLGRVVPRSRLFRELPELVGGLLG